MNRQSLERACAASLAVLSLLSPEVARAEPITCNNNDYPIVNEVIFDSMSSVSDYVDFHGKHFILEDGHGLIGIEEDLHRDVNKHMMASVLITRGVGGEALSPAQDESGSWFLPRPLEASPFHRSGDEWGPMVGGWGLQAMSEVDGNGQLHAGKRFHSGHRSRKASEPLWGDGRNRSFLDLDSLPDTALEYDCEAFDKPVFALDASGNRTTLVRGTDAIGFARLIVHESWHTIGLGHSDSDLNPGTSNQCNEAEGNKSKSVCNEFVPRVPGSHNGELAKRNTGPFIPMTGPGSYQLAEEFNCDLALHAAEWVPLMVSLEADFDHDRFFNRDYYTNIDRHRITGPFACDAVVHEAFREASGLGRCGLDENVCRDDADCDQSSIPQLCELPGYSGCVACLTHADCPAEFLCQNHCCARIQ